MMGGTTSLHPDRRILGTDASRRPQRGRKPSSAFHPMVTPSFREFSPRLAFRFDFDRNCTQVPRGGAGILVGRAPLAPAANPFETERPPFHILCEGNDAPTLDIERLLAATPRNAESSRLQTR